MADLKTLANSRSALLNFDPRDIRVKPGLNARDLSIPENAEHVEYLCGSIMENGYLPSHPLEIFQEDGQVFVSSGHCRLAAVMLAISRGCDIKVVPCVPERRGTNEFERILHQSLDNSGKRLSPLEEGYNIKRALNLGATVKQIAELLHKSETFVTNALDFQAAPVEVHDMVRAGDVSATLAAQVVRKRGKEGVEALKTAVTHAKASGKGKATAKHIEAAGEAAYNERRDPVESVKIIDKGGDAWGVSIGRADLLMSGDAWVRLCQRIIDTIHPRPSFTPTDADIAEVTRAAATLTYVPVDELCAVIDAHVELAEPDGWSGIVVGMDLSKSVDELAAMKPPTPEEFAAQLRVEESSEVAK